MFLDVGLEQGLFGGLSFLFLYLAGLWMISGAISKEKEDNMFQWIVLFSLTVAFVHGMVDNYLYNGGGAMLSLLLVGLSMNAAGYGEEIRKNRFDLWTVGAITGIWVIVVLTNLNQIRAVWYANIGAVQLAKEELAGFPDSGWVGTDIIPQLDMVDASLRSALRFDPTNRSANQRLGLINMYRRDFETAIYFLETARFQAPNHRGIIKSLGYSYAWSGDIDKAQLFLSQIPEAVEELDVYIWWWDAQGQSELSNNAVKILEKLNSATP